MVEVMTPWVSTKTAGTESSLDEEDAECFSYSKFRKGHLSTSSRGGIAGLGWEGCSFQKMDSRYF
jgi:hypothetical protein